MFGDSKTDLSQPSLPFTLSFSLFSFFFFFRSLPTRGLEGSWERQASRFDKFGRQNEIYCSNVQGVRHSKRLHPSVQQVEGVCSRWGILAIFPAELLPVALYLQHLIESTSSCSSVDATFYGLKWVHETARLVSPTDSSLVVAFREASKRILGTGRSNRKEPKPRESLTVWNLEMFVSMNCVSRASSGLTMSVESKETKFPFIVVTCLSRTRKAKMIC